MFWTIIIHTCLHTAGRSVYISDVVDPASTAKQMIGDRKLLFPNPYVKTKQAWLETLSTLEDVKLDIVDLHPDIFGMYPR